jgi:hypothetical protein
MATGVRSRYHIAIDGNGFMLRGAPSSPRYVKSNAASILASFRIQNEAGIVDLNNNQFTGSGWNYWAQTDWSGGLNVLKFKDDASFKSAQGVDVITKYGQLSLQNGWTSAAIISGSHSYGAHQVHGLDLLLGTVKAGAAKVFKLTSANTITTLSAMAGISAVNTMDRFNNNTIIGLTRTSGSTLNTLVKYNGSSISGFRSANPIVRSNHSIGIRHYTGEYVSSLSGDALYYTTDLATFTSAYQAGKGRKISIIDDVNGSPYFFISEGKRVEMFKWDEFAGRPYPIYSWENLTNFSTKKYASLMMVTGTSNGKSVAFAFNGARLVDVLTDQLLDTSWDFSHPFEYQGNLQLKGAAWDQNVWLPGLYGKLSGVVVTPFENFNNTAYGFARSGTKTLIGYLDSTKYNTSGYLISSEFGAIIGGVDKLVNSVDINMETLSAGQTIEVFRSTDEGNTFNSIGKASYTQDNAIRTKTLYFPSGFVTRLWSYKTTLVGPGTSSPVLKDITHQFRPVPDLRKTWTLSIDAGNDIKLLNKQSEERDGKYLMQQLWLQMEAKKKVQYEDVDSFSINIVSAMSSGATSARVENTRLMPPKGRIRVYKSNQAEEMTYTSADGGKILGISRGQKHTLARAYTSADKIDNFYQVIVTNVREQVNDTDQKTTESIAQVTLLEV